MGIVLCKAAGYTGGFVLPFGGAILVNRIFLKYRRPTNIAIESRNYYINKKP
ncbi:MAG: hypothetical protein JWR02_2326 [Mucilaginibacter sp.]|nr:hypothetical protein [Mucilaginibacter sp.]